MVLIGVFSVDSLSPALDPSDLILTRGTLDEEDEEADSDTDDIDHRGERWPMKREQLLILTLFVQELFVIERHLMYAASDRGEKRGTGYSSRQEFSILRVPGLTR